MRIKVSIEYEDMPSGSEGVSPLTIRHEMSCGWDDSRESVDHIGDAVSDCVLRACPRPFAVLCEALLHLEYDELDGFFDEEVMAATSAAKAYLKRWDDEDAKHDDPQPEE